MGSDGRADFDPKEIARATFPTAFRGYDTEAVRRYLTRLAAAIGRAQEGGRLSPFDHGDDAEARVAEAEHEAALLRDRVVELEEQVRAQASHAPPEPVEPAADRTVPEAELIEQLGKETARIVEAARAAAADITHRAEEEASLVRAEATLEARAARSEAEDAIAGASVEAEKIVAAASAEAVKTQARIKADVKRSREHARSKAEKLLADASAKAEGDLAAARQRGNQIVADAEALREEILGDLVRRRRLHGEQLDRLTDARDRLAQALAGARNELDEVASDLHLSIPGSVDIDLTDELPERQAGDHNEVAELVSQLQGVGDGGVASMSGGAAVLDPPTTGQGPGNGSTHQGPSNGSGPHGASSTGADVAGPTANGFGGHDGDGPGGSVDDADLGRAEGGIAAPVRTDLDDDAVLDPSVLTDPTMVALTGDPASFVSGMVDAPIVDRSDRTGGEPPFDVDELLEVDDRPATGQTPVADGIGPAASELLELDLDPERGPDPAPPPANGGELVGANGEVIIDLTGSPAYADPVLGAGPGAMRRTATRGDLPRNTPYAGKLPPAFEGRDIALNRSTAGFRRRLKRAVNDDQSDVLDRLRAGRGTIHPTELPSVEDQLHSYVAALRPALNDVVAAGGELLGSEDVPAAAVDNLCLQLAKHIVENLRRPTEGAIEVAIEGDREAILDPVRAIYRDFRNTTLPDLIEDALHEAYALGLFHAIEPGTLVIWQTDPRLDPDPICEENSASVALPKGAEFPSGHARPLSMPGCRCLAVPA